MSDTRADGQRWIELEGADNVRDLGGLPTAEGHAVQPARLIRADSLQDLTEADVHRLIDDLHVTAVADLRTGVEVQGEGPGPITRLGTVDVRHLSLFPEPDSVTVEADEPVVLPWNERDANLSEENRRRGASGIYASYLEQRPDSIIAALRLIASTEGATIVHCAAGKDRTGTVVALALAEVGVPAEEIVEDYALSGERIDAIMNRLIARRTYATDLVNADESFDKHKPRPETMRTLLATMDQQFGGVGAWLRANGWTEDDAAALRAKLLD